MTQNTEQDRAEFEVAYVSEKLRIIGSEGSADGEKAIRAIMLRRNANGDYDNSLEVHFAWWAWQAARRAQVVPQRWKLVPVEPTSEMCFKGAVQIRWSAIEQLAAKCYNAMLAAAPQPPDLDHTERHLEMVATTVQLPEPEWWINYCAATSRETASRIQESELASAPLYTEQQVRQLLADNGIGKDKA